MLSTEKLATTVLEYLKATEYTVEEVNKEGFVLYLTCPICGYSGNLEQPHSTLCPKGQFIMELESIIGGK